MDSKDDKPDPNQIAREVRIAGYLAKADDEIAKFDYFFNGFVFTVFGLGVQTTKFSTPPRDSLQTIAFILLFAVGGFSLYRVKRRAKHLLLRADT